MIASCYSMDLYCDNQKRVYTEDMLLHAHKEFPHQFTGETFGGCKRQAVKRGWKFTRDGKHYCPKCKGPKP
jgi:hypothetical protein